MDGDDERRACRSPVAKQVFPDTPRPANTRGPRRNLAHAGAYPCPSVTCTVRSERVKKIGGLGLEPRMCGTRRSPLVWPAGFALAQVVKAGVHRGEGIVRRVGVGTEATVVAALAASHGGTTINTARARTRPPVPLAGLGPTREVCRLITVACSCTFRQGVALHSRPGHLERDCRRGCPVLDGQRRFLEQDPVREGNPSKREGFPS